MAVYSIDVLTDPRWESFLLEQPRASIFHTRPWLEALRRTYDYKPVAFTTSAPGEPLSSALVFCEVKSWITGRRLVSLPFSDHCDLLASSARDEEEILSHVQAQVARDGFKYAELRPLPAEGESAAAAWRPADEFCMHVLSLDAPLEKLFVNLHKDCYQRKIRRAEREELRYEKGHSEAHLRAFYQLMLRTRRRHCLPPAPLQWFRNLTACMGDQLTIRIASKGDEPVAAILTLSFKDDIVYKYGCSDERFNNLGGTPFLFWKTIQEAKGDGMRRLDLGRSDTANDGLIAFKDRMGAARSLLRYRRCGDEKNAGTADSTASGWLAEVAKKVFPRLPDTVLTASGRFLYRHIG